MARYKASAVVEISQQTFNDVDDFIKACQESGRSVQYGMNALATICAYANVAIAREMSEGPNDPRMQNPQWAWKIPVRRITGRYYKGWKVKRLAPGVWMVYNDSREAWFIEFGIHPSGFHVEARGGKQYLKGSARVRRPVGKLSMMRTLKFIDQTKAAEHVWNQTFAPFRPGRRITSRNEAMILDQVQSLPGMRFI